MKEFKGKVAVITGAAAGIGRAIAENSAREGMKVVLSDIEEEALTKTEEEMKAAGATVLAVVTDVSKASDVEVLAQKTLQAFSAVHLLCNNAGVNAGTSIWESTIADWKWVIDVNLWGVIHGVRTFVPIMLRQDIECHIVNTASIAGLVAGPNWGIYKVTKHGVVALSETLYCELMERNANIKVSVLCPGFVNTRILDSERNRPPELKNDPSEGKMSPKDEALDKKIRKTFRTAMPTDQIADCVFNAIREEKLYILTHPGSKEMIRSRMANILQERNQGW
jgi:NAD(P)-dependent dehydrogenase (short-subunit alcohol dehydrogenase family)